MKKEELYSEVLGCGVTTYYNWKREDNRPVMKLLDQYFQDEDLIEFLDSNRIQKFKLIDEFTSKQFQYNKIILEVFKTFQIYDEEKNPEDYDYRRYNFVATSYTFQFIKYLLSTDEINLDTYNEYLISEHKRVLLENEYAHSVIESHQDTHSEDFTESQFEAEAKNQEEIDITAILNSNHKLICEAKREILLQLEILKTNDFLPLVEQATKKEVKEFLLPFLIRWISEKYNANFTKTQETINNISNFKKTDLQEVIKNIQDIS